MQYNNPYIANNPNNTNSYPQPYPNNPAPYPATNQQTTYYSNDNGSANNLGGQGQTNQQTYGAKYENNSYGYNVQPTTNKSSNCCESCCRCLNSQ